jgi:hypothetical protein
MHDYVEATLRLPVAAVRVESPAQLVSQQTSEPVLGIDRRRFLEAMHGFRAAGGEVIRLGKLRLVRPAEFVAWLAGRATPRAGQDDTGELAESLGLRVVGVDRG